MNDKGFSLLQVIFASSVVGALTLVGVQMMKEQQELAKNTSQRFEEEYILEDMRHILSDPVNCRETFKNLGKDDKQISIDHLSQMFQLKDSSEQSRIFLYQVYDKSKRVYGNENIKIKSLRLVKKESDKNFSARSQLEVVFDRGKDSFKEVKGLKKIPIDLEFTQPGTLKTCSITSTPIEDPYWELHEHRDSQQEVTMAKDKFKVLINASQAKELPESVETKIWGNLRANASSTPECQSLLKGSFIYSIEKDAFVFCDKSNHWKEVNSQKLSYKNSQNFEIKKQKSETQVPEALICSLEQSKDLPLGAKCELTSPQNLDLDNINIDPGTWRLSLTGQAKATSKCVFRCYF